jgi:hypothetical protein
MNDIPHLDAAWRRLDALSVSDDKLAKDVKRVDEEHMRLTFRLNRIEAALTTFTQPRRRWWKRHIIEQGGKP